MALPGRAIGQTLTLRFGDEVDVAEVGLIPGYAKTDPTSGVDRYAENNRITGCAGTSATESPWSSGSTRTRPARDAAAAGSPHDHRPVTLEILAVKRGPRSATAISQIAISSAN